MSESLRIAFLTSAFLPFLGGAEVGLHNLALRLVARGHKPVLIVPYTNYSKLQKERWDLPYDIERLPPKVFSILSHFPRLGFFILDRVFAKLQAKHHFDFWHGTMGFPPGVALAHFACQHSHVRHLVRCAGEDIQRDDGIGYGSRLDPRIDRLMRQWLPRADCLVAISDTVVDEYRSLGVAEERILRIPNGVDLKRFSENGSRLSIRAKLGLSDDTFLFLAVGRNHRKKNFSALVTAAAYVTEKVTTPFCVVVAGSGTSELLPLAKRAGVSAFIKIDEEVSTASLNEMNLPVQSLVDLYRAADSFVFPSLMETFGVVLAEAMAAGLPIITTDGPGCRDMVRNGRDGMVVPAGDAEALGQAMIRIIDEPALRKDLAVRAQERAQDFSWDHVVDLYLDVYKNEFS